MKTLRICLIIFSTIFCNQLHAEIVHIPTEAFASKPDISQIKLSPNGKQIAMLSKLNNVTAIQYVDLTTMKSYYLAKVDDTEYSIFRMVWANDEDLLLHVRFTGMRGVVPIVETRILKKNIYEDKIKPILSPYYLGNLHHVSNIMDTVIDYLDDDPDHILMALSGASTTANTSRGVEPSVVKVSIHGKNHNKMIQPAIPNVSSWRTDQQHNVRIAITRDEASYKILERSNADEDFRTLWEFDAFSQDEVWPIGFDLEPNILYVQALHKGFDAVFKVDLNDKTLKRHLVYWKEGEDASSGLRRDLVSRKVIGIGNDIWDDEHKAFIKGIDHALPDTKNYLVAMSKDKDKYVVLSTNDKEPGIYFLGSRKTKKLSVFAARYSGIAPEHLADKKPISYNARDGLQIEGFLTLPRVETAKKLPTIIFPHGGPISFDDDGFDYWTQFFANRGYAVLQMNFRGSYGRGFDFMSKGLAGWGQAMQDDIEDGTKWMIEQGYADPAKICIVGASYGGYAALMGAVKTPDLYQCAISFAGISDIEELVKDSRGFTNHKIVKKQIGDDYDKLWDYSPLKHAQKITIPVMLIHGSDDTRVWPKQSEMMFDKLKGLDKKVEYIELDGGDHHLSNTEHRLITFKAMEKFLQQQLPTKTSNNLTLSKN